MNMNKTEAKNILTDIFNLKSDIENEIEKLPTRFNIVNSIVGSHIRNIENNILRCFKNIDKDGCLSKPEEYIESNWYIDYTLNLNNLEKEIENAKNNMVSLFNLLNTKKYMNIKSIN